MTVSNHMNSYVVKKAVIYAGREYLPGEEFPAEAVIYAGKVRPVDHKQLTADGLLEAVAVAKQKPATVKKKDSSAKTSESKG